jgi:hypothetical protein
MLVQLKARPTFQEQWPEQYNKSILKGKLRLLQLESIRKDKLTIEKILSARDEILKWWSQIGE